MRPADYDDVSAAIAAMHKMKRRRPDSKNFFGEEAVVAEALKEAVDEGQAVVVGPYFIFFQFGYPWFSSKLMLFEKMVIRINHDEGKPQDAVDALELIGRQHGVSCIFGGDGQTGQMSSVYLAAGWQHAGDQFIKRM